MNAIKAELHHGEWLAFLAAEGLNRETARSMRRLASEYQIAELMRFGSVDAAMKALPPKTPVRNAPEPAEASDAEMEAFEGTVDLDDAGGEALEESKFVHVTANSGDMEWFTPPDILETVRSVLGDFLDPASCAAAQETVQAERHFTIEDDGLEQEWTGNVFLNPPYDGD